MIAFLLVSCACAAGVAALGPSAGQPGSSRQGVATIRDLVTGQHSPAGATESERAALAALYGPGMYAPLWVDAAGRATPSAHDALALFTGAAAEGLDPAAYDGARLEGEARALPGASPATFDVGVSLGLLRYLKHLHMGRVDPRRIGFQMAGPEDHHDFPALVRSAALEGRVRAEATALTPPLAQYRSLRTMLARYRALAADPALPAARLPEGTLRPGDSYDDAPSLHRWLAALGDGPDNAAPAATAVYSDALAQGVTRFQARHGLVPDGVVGPRTRAAMQVPLSWRVRQIEMALERFRWLPHLGARRLIAINIPMFRLWAWDSVASNPMPSFASDVIVGRAALSTQTPVFDEELQYVIFRPYWNVPRSIAIGEILPALARDPRYLAREDMELVRGPGDNATPVAATPEAIDLLRQGQLRVRQRPGPRNALGLVKFVFPNDDAVYMHDTPAQALFEQSRRDFSHGCVRVEDPVGLAEWVLRGQDSWDREAIQAAMRDTAPHRVDLPVPIQVILFYVTAAVMPEDGQIHFAEDIYRHDDRLDRALRAVSAEAAGARP